MGNEDPEKKFDEASRLERSGSEEGEAPAQMSGTSIDFRPGYGLGLSLARLLEIIGWVVLVVAGVATVVLIVQMPNRMALLVGAGAAFSGLMPAASTRIKPFRLWGHMAAISAATQPPMEEPIKMYPSRPSFCAISRLK
jgi:hypothetical protein